MSRGKIVLLVALIVVGAGSYAMYHRSVSACRELDGELNHRVEVLQHKAHEGLRVGSTKKRDVLRFFAQNGIRLEDDEDGVSGEVRAPGCSPGCDIAVIRVKANFDETGILNSEPTVQGVYPYCM